MPKKTPLSAESIAHIASGEIGILAAAKKYGIGSERVRQIWQGHEQAVDWKAVVERLREKLEETREKAVVTLEKLLDKLEAQEENHRKELEAQKENHHRELEERTRGDNPRGNQTENQLHNQRDRPIQTQRDSRIGRGKQRRKKKERRR